MDPGQKIMIRLDRVGFTYPSRSEPALSDIDFSVPAGQAVLLTGPTGCGKSTLLKVITGIIPLESSGRMTGRVLAAGRETRDSTVAELAETLGLVFQSPDDQLFCSTVGEEVGFGPYNLGLDSRRIDLAVDRALKQTGLSGFHQRPVNQLSGGQKQRVAIACQLAMEPKLLALDEPISQLDPQGAAEVIACLGLLKKNGLTIFLVEHRLSEVMNLVDRVMVMDQGKIVLDTGREDLAAHIPLLQTLGLEIPESLDIAGRLGLKLQGDWDRDLLDLAGAFTANGRDFPGRQPIAPARSPLMRIERASYTYGRSESPALDEIDLTVEAGEVLAVLGHNGSGKTTLLRLMAGLFKPNQGCVLLRDRPLINRKAAVTGDRIGFLFQNPDLFLIESTVDRELLSGPDHLKFNKTESRTRARDLAVRLDLMPYGDLPPWTLSKGQRLRVALGAILAMKPGLLLLDEPTTGQNQENIYKLLETVKVDHHVKTVVFCSHDLEAVSRIADRVVLLKQGRILARGNPRQILGDPDLLREAGLKPTVPVRLSLAMGLEPPALTREEFIRSVVPPKAATA